MRDTGVFARNREPNSVAVSNWAESTDFTERLVSESGKKERQTYLKHSEQKMLFSALVLVSVQRKHDGLEECVNLSEADKTT